MEHLRNALPSSSVSALRRALATAVHAAGEPVKDALNGSRSAFYRLSKPDAYEHDAFTALLDAIVTAGGSVAPVGDAIAKHAARGEVYTLCLHTALVADIREEAEAKPLLIEALLKPQDELAARRAVRAAMREELTTHAVRRAAEHHYARIG
jgi:hypothetical protein